MPVTRTRYIFAIDNVHGYYTRLRAPLFARPDYAADELSPHLCRRAVIVAISAATGPGPMVGSTPLATRRRFVADGHRGSKWASPWH